MALYEYQCPDCLKVSDHTHAMTDRPNILCTDCGDSLVKVIGLGGVHYKGFGWACTDSTVTRTANEIHGR